MPLPYDQRFTDPPSRNLRKIRPLGSYAREEEFELGGVRIVRYSRPAERAFGMSLSQIILWDAEGIGAWKVLPLPASKPKIYVNRSSHKFRWTKYWEAVRESSRLDERFSVRVSEGGSLLVVADGVLKVGWVYAKRRRVLRVHPCARTGPR